MHIFHLEMNFNKKKYVHTYVQVHPAGSQTRVVRILPHAP